MSTHAPTGAPDSRSPVARGRLEERPFPRLLHQLFGKRVTGCLQLVDDSQDESRVYLRDGAPVHVVRPNDLDRLDQVITEANLLPAHVVAEVSGALPAGRRLGEVLVERGLINPAGLADALKLQMRRKLLRLFFPQRGTFAVFVDPHNYGVGDEFKEMRVDPRCLMYPGVRAAYDDARLKAELAPLTNHRFRVLPTLSGSLLEAMGFRANDPLVIAMSDKWYTLADLPASGARALDAGAIVLALLYTDLLETNPIVPAAVAMAQTVRSMPAVTDAMLAAGPGAQAPVNPMGRTGSFPAANVTDPMRRSGSFPAAAAVDPMRRSGNFPAVNLADPMRRSGSFPAAAAVDPMRRTGSFPAAAAVDPMRRTGSFPAAGSTGRSGTYLAVGGGTERMGGAPGASSASSGSLPVVASPVGATMPAPVPAATPGGAGPAGQPGAPGPASANVAALLQRLDELVGRLGSLSHFELLGVAETASSDEIGAAYLRGMRQFHPDRLASLGLKEWTEKAARLVAHMNEANGVLTDPRRRAEYVASRNAPPQLVDSGRAIIAAEESFQRGETMLKKGDHARALEAFSAAMKLNPAEPAYKAYWAWTRFDSPTAPKDRLVRDTLKVLDEVLRDRGRFAVAHYWMGLLHKHLGDNNAAENAFRAAIGQDKSLLEAERELRLIEMRKQKAASATAADKQAGGSATRKETGGLFNKFLKR
jgi:curved DNA-binding protein CbpA